MLAVAMGVNMYDLADYILDDGLSRLMDTASLRRRLSMGARGADEDAGPNP